MSETNHTSDYAFVILDRGSQIPLPKVQGRGRPKGTGCNLRLLNSMKVGDSAWGIPASRVHSLRQTAFMAKMRLKFRQIPDSDTFVVKRIT